MSYMEQSTRYIPYDGKLGGRYRYYRDRAVLADPQLAWRYIADLDGLFDTYTGMLPKLLDWARERYPKDPADSDFVYKQSIRAKACDAARGILPAATLSNVGVYGSGQAFEALLLRMRAHPLPEAHDLRGDDARGAAQGHPVVRRPGRPPGSWRRVERATSPRRATTPPELVHRIFGSGGARAAPVGHPHRLRSRRRGQAPRRHLLPAHAAARRPDPGPCAHARRRRARRAAPRRTWGSASNRRHRPGRAFERVDYRFDIVADYGAFRDLQRHRMLTIEWQPLSHAPRLRRTRGDRRSRAARPSSTTRWNVRPRSTTRSLDPFPEQASYAVSLAYRHPLRDADERARGDAPARAAHHAVGPPRVPAGRARRCTGSSPSRPATARSPTRCRTSTTPPTSSSASPPSAPPTPGAPPTRSESTGALPGDAAQQKNSRPL